MGNLNLYSDLKYCFTNYNNLFIMLFKVTHVCNVILKILVDNKYIYIPTAFFCCVWVPWGMYGLAPWCQLGHSCGDLKFLL